MKDLLFILLFFPLCSLSQSPITFQRTLGAESDSLGTRRSAIEHDSINGGYIVVGTGFLEFDNFTSDRYISLQKMDDDGNTLWDKNWTQPSCDCWLRGHAVAPTSDGGFVCAGQSELWEIKPYFDGCFLIMTDGNGDITWAKKYLDGGRSLETNRIVQMDDGGYMLSGHLKQTNQCCFSNMFMIRTDMNGDTLWTKRYTTGDFDSPYENYDYASWMEKTADGGYITCGQAKQDEGEGLDALVVKFEANGDVEWSKTYGHIDALTRAHGIQEKSTGGFMVAGSFGDGINSKDALVMNLDPNGNVIWVNAYGGSGGESFKSVVKTGSNYVYTGTTDSWASTEAVFDVLVVALLPSGNVDYAKLLGGENSDYGISATSSSSSEYVILGTTSSFSDGSLETYIAASDNGSSGCNEIEVTPEITPLDLDVVTVSLNVRHFQFPYVADVIIEEFTIDTYSNLLCHSNSVSEIEQQDGFRLNVFPNPSNGAFQISFPEDANMAYDVKVINTYGQLVYTTESVSKSERIQLTELPTGNYILEARFRDRWKRCLFGVIGD